jgi:hypothetical protein
MEVRLLNLRALPIVPPIIAAVRIIAPAVIANLRVIARAR